MKKKFFIIYERFAEFNQFEGSWEIDYEEFATFEEAQSWIAISRPAEECRLHKRKLIGPLSPSV